MRTVTNRQHGFSIVEAVLVVAAIAVVGTAGWFVYQHNRVKPANAATVSQPTPQQTVTTNQTVISVPELGIKITTPDNLKDLIYRVGTVTLVNGRTATLAYFSTTSLAAADAGCGTNSGPLGSLEKVEGQYPTSDPYAELRYGQLVKQFSTFYISAGVPNGGGCSTSSDPSVASSVNATASSSKAAFVAARSSIQSLN